MRAKQTAVIQLHLTHVLITRPLEASQQLSEWLSERFDALGLTPVVMPFYDFSASVAGPELEEALSRKNGRRLAVFTSPRAVEYGLKQIPVPMLKGLEFAAVGSATRAKLEKAGCEVTVQSATGYTSEDLLQHAGLVDSPGAAIIFCAPGGRTKLATGLREKGWQVFQARVYQRVPIPPAGEKIDQLLSADSLLSVWTSVSAITLAESCLPADAWAKIVEAPALVISARIQHHLSERGAGKVVLADGPGNPALLDSITRLAGREIKAE